MNRDAAIILFDIGKTNKKVLLLDERYKVIYEESIQFDETADEDGFPCDDLSRLSSWVLDSMNRHVNSSYEIRAVNISAYGASLVHVNKAGKVLTPLYNYLKPFPPELKNQFYREAGGEENFCMQTASPPLGHLNSGLQLYWLKKAKPNVFTQVKYSLHLPQYISWLLTAKACAEITSIGCHTALWDFASRDYHSWVYAEGITEKFPPIVSAQSTVGSYRSVPVGTGLHDSSAALIPYLIQFKEPFVLLSTGTWSISLNAFSRRALNIDDLRNDCLCYLDYEGNPVKAARLFAGHEHEEQTKRLAAHFMMDPLKYQSVVFQHDLAMPLINRPSLPFAKRELSLYKSYEDAYHQLVLDMIRQQRASTNRILEDDIDCIYVDGGFSRNPVFMNLLAAAYPQKRVFATTVHQASAMGAALVIHSSWNRLPEQPAVIEQRAYSPDPRIAFD